MTVPLTGNRQTFAGSGSSGPFPVTAYGIFKTTDVQVTLKTDATGAFVSKLLTTDYTVTLTDPANLPSTFTINWVSTNPAVGETVIADLFIPFTQLLDFLRRGKFPSESNEEGLDRAMTGLAQLAGPLGLLTYNVEQTDFLSLAAASLDQWDIQSRIMINGVDPVNQQDLATKAFVEATVTGSGLLPPSTAVDDILVGTGAAFIIKTAEQFVAIYAGDGLEADGSGNFRLDLQALGGLEFNNNEVRCTALLRDLSALTLTKGDIVVFDGTNLNKLDAGANGSIIVYDSTQATGLKAQSPALTIAFPPEHLSGLEMTNGTDTAHDIDIAAGDARDFANTEDFTITAKTTQIDVVAGSGNGGFPSGLTLTADTWYRVGIISNGVTPVIGFDTAANFSNLRADHTGSGGADFSAYTTFIQVGWALVDGSSNIIQSTQNPEDRDEVLWLDPPRDVNVSNLGTSATLFVVSAPPSTTFFGNASCRIAGSQPEVYLSSPSVNDEAPTRAGAPLATINGETNDVVEVAIVGWVRTNSSSQIRARSSGASTLFQLVTLGYRYRRGA